MSNVLNYSGSSKMDRNVVDSMSSLLQDELDGIAGMDIPFNSSDFMSSDFFDSVLSMERENALDGVLENNYDYDLNMSDSGTTNSHIESVHSPCTASSDSDQYLQCTENNGITLFGSDDNSEIIDSSDLMPFFKNKELSPVFPTIPPNQMIIRRQNRQNNKKVLVTNPINVKSNNKNAVSKSQVIRVQSISGNGRSLLLPVNVKKIKIVNANSLKMENLKVIPSNQQQILRKMHVEKYAASSSSAESVDDLDELDIETNNMRGDRSYPPLELNSEERRLLYKEGIKLPTHYPLTKHEEKELKRIRRKIRNKISAQDSRKRKKEYVDKLEEKAKRTCEENECLKKRIKMLRKQNGKLMEQMRKLQEVLFRTSSSKATPTTCLMIVLFSTLLVCLPNMRTTSEKKDLEIGEQHLVAARRALLFNQKGSPEEDTINMDDFLVFNRDEESELESFEETDSAENGTNGGDNSGFKHFLGELARKYEALAATDGNNAGAGLRTKLPEFEPELLRRCVETSNGGDLTRSKPNGSLLEFCTKYEDEIRGMVDNMRTILQQEEPLTPPASDEEEAVVDHQFIEPDISDDEYSVIEEYDGDGGKDMMSNSYLWDDDDPPTKRRRMSSGELVEQRHHAVETVSPLLETTRRYNAKKQ